MYNPSTVTCRLYPLGLRYRYRFQMDVFNRQIEKKNHALEIEITSFFIFTCVILLLATVVDNRSGSEIIMVVL